MIPPSVLEGLSHNEKRLLLALEREGGESSPEQLLADSDFQLEVEIMNSASWLQTKGLLTIDEDSERFYRLGNTDVIAEGLPERRALEHIHAKGGEVTISELNGALPAEDAKVAVGWLKRKGLADIVVVDDSKSLRITEKGKAYLDSESEDEELLRSMAEAPVSEREASAKILKDLTGRRGMVVDELRVRRTLALTPAGLEALEAGIELREEIVQLTPELLQSGKWRDKSFRPYDVQTYAPANHPAKRHPLTRLGDKIRSIFLQMGFAEIEEEYVQSAFWNMDVLFTPQDHPARDLHDTFYLEDPAEIELDDKEMVEKVRRIHIDGGDTGSKGWGGEWSEQVASKAMLRTHTTVNTIRHLAKNPDAPQKVFSLGRLHRNEAIDSTHLPEFTQIEGIVVDENGSFDMLVSILREFYKRMGFEEMRIRPAYFPYTEPSLEVEVFFNGKWMELGGAVIFRPEVVAPFGVKHPVLAWGLGFERLAMLTWDMKDIRDLYVSDIDMLRRNTVF